MKFKGILIDLDNTLYDYKKAHNTALKNVLIYLETKFLIKQNQLAKSYLNARATIAKNLKYTAASHNRILYFQNMLESFHIYSSQETIKIYNLYWKVFLKNMPLHNGVVHFLEKIKKKKIFIITNLTAHIQHRKITTLGIQKYINYLVTSEEAGVEKPNSKIFLMALQKLNMNTNDVCMIGDNFKKDINGASQLNITSFWLHSYDKLKLTKKNIYIFQEFKNLENLINETCS